MYQNFELAINELHICQHDSCSVKVAHPQTILVSLTLTIVNTNVFESLFFQ